MKTKIQTMNLRKTIQLLALAFLVTTCLYAGNTALGQIPVAQFYQHQAWLPATNGNAGVPQPGALGAAWETGGGWCGPTAVTDALYPWYVATQTVSLGTVNLFNRAGAALQITNPGGGAVTIGTGTWVPGYESVVNAMQPIIGRPGQNINTFLNAVGSGPQQAGLLNPFTLTDTTYNINNATGQVTTQLANGKVITEPGTPFAEYSSLVTHGSTTVLSIADNGKPNTLWWGNYHALAGAGLTGNANQLWVADPDSVPVNGGPLGGWTVATVKANLYTNAQAAGGVPIVGNAGYTNANLYGTITLDANGNITAASNTNYSVPAVTMPATNPPVTYLTNIDAITPTWLKFIQSVLTPPGGGGPDVDDDTLEVDGPQQGLSVDQLEIFPVGGLADDNDFSFTDPGWTESQVLTDPFGDAMPGGGELLQLGTGSDLTNGQDFDATLDTSSNITGWDVFEQFTDGTWQVQSYGAPGDALPDQVGVPEPASLASLALGFLVLRRRHRAA